MALWWEPCFHGILLAWPGSHIGVTAPSPSFMGFSSKTDNILSHSLHYTSCFPFGLFLCLRHTGGALACPAGPVRLKPIHGQVGSITDLLLLTSSPHAVWLVL